MVLGLDLGSVLGGFAAEGTRYFDEVEKEMSGLIEKRMDLFSSRGSKRWESHKATKKLTRQLAKSLKAYGLSVDQIGVALEQGRGQQVLERMQKYDSASEAVKEAVGYDINNIVNMGENYESSGLTMDEMIDSVTGKVSGGMNLTDAFADIGQSKQNTFAKLFNPNMNKMIKKRMEAYESVYGKGALDTMQRYATGEITTTPLPFTGKINLRDVLEEKKILDTLNKTNVPSNYNTFRNSLLKAAENYIGADPERAGIPGGIYISPDAKDRLGAEVAGHFMTNIDSKLTAIAEGMSSGDKYGPKMFEEVTADFDNVMKSYKASRAENNKNLEKNKKEAASATIQTLQDQPKQRAFTAEEQEKWIEEYAQALVDSGQIPAIKMAETYARSLFNSQKIIFDNLPKSPSSKKSFKRTGSSKVSD